VIEFVCYSHQRGTVDGTCPDCEAEALDAILLIEAGVAGARFWAEGVLARYKPPRDVSVAYSASERPL
jgi:hypothetical protein